MWEEALRMWRRGGIRPFMFGFYPQDNCGETYYTIQFQTTNDQSFGDYADGFTPNNSSAAFGVRAPGCQVADDLTRELGDPFRRDALAKPVRFLDKYKDYV